MRSAPPALRTNATECALCADAEVLYLVMDLLQGGDLKYHLIEEGQFGEERTRLYSAELLLALEHMHGQGVIYRDLKLENVILDDKGHARLVDLGLAVLAKDQFVTGYAGTPGYCAPEMVANFKARVHAHACLRLRPPASMLTLLAARAVRQERGLFQLGCPHLPHATRCVCPCRMHLPLAQSTARVQAASRSRARPWTISTARCSESGPISTRR